MGRVSGAVTGIAFALLASPLGAQAQGAAAVEIVDWGTYVARDVGADPAPETTSGYVRTSEMGPIHRTDQVDACLGARFGIRYRLADPGAAEILPVTIETAHPPFPGRDGRPATIERWRTRAGVEPNGAGWVFDEIYELVPGQWTISILADGKVLAAKTFTVRTPETCDRPLS